MAAYQHALQLDPEDAWSMNNLALIWMQQGRFADALPALARAVELRHDVATFYNNLGMALERTGHFRDAEEAYATAVKVAPSYEKAAANGERVAGVTESPAWSRSISARWRRVSRR